MDSTRGLKKPTIKDKGRAYVRLFEFFETPESWLGFLDQYAVETTSFGSRWDADCTVRVIDRATGDLAALGLHIPNHIHYHTFSGERSFWNEWYLSATEKRHRVLEIGDDRPSKDETKPR
ncbi:hypothetical protein [Burkholderia gladioli]|uniref:hypothetical protein n=1 Tax=Burkholderia gladioli TaxID=28095 RepID=UPI00163F30CA|nr:hypothetical protein [Burkholderia gladioli]